MASANVKLDLSPSEFDLVREALRFTESNETATADDKSTDMKMRVRARVQAKLLGDLLGKLNA